MSFQPFLDNFNETFGDILPPVHHTKESQEAQILAWFKRGRLLTPLNALHLFGCNRLAARVCSLRKQGYDIKTQRVKTAGGAVIARYYLKKEPN